MKNTIPLIIAVILGLAAVFAVSHTMAQKEDRRDKKIEVLIAKGDMKAGERLKAGTKEIPLSAFKAHQHVEEASRPIVEGLELARDLPEGSFIFWQDIINDAGMLSAEVGKGEWAVPVRFSDTSLLDFIEAGDEIAIVMVKGDSRDTVAPGGNVTERERVFFQNTSVLFPSVRVTKKQKGTVVVSLKPDLAMVLLTANLNAHLYPMLRNRKDDDANVRRAEFSEISSDRFEAHLPDSK
ncbi:MAG: hypothetical protein FWF84_01450 [Kiritimatiellaeota bacterium]|nr:hypothetical protein [Kiritimatiellota bacterium]